MALNKLTNAVVSATNENTLALANFNFDFSLVKFDAPKEFAPFGSALTVQRRTIAEDGPVHQVVRKLGALFEQLLPSTPKLIEAYGIRVSEIIQSPKVNPEGSRADGPFETFVGADGTSIWAAATSGPASISVLLLAYILVRKFDDARFSRALWVELVHQRQEEIKQSLEDGHIVSIASAMAARQTISRDDLAVFDASARSWLSSADSAKEFQQNQLMLILKNIPSWVNAGPSTYSKVITAWKAALQGLEDLLNNKPQQISDGTILLAISAWHIYPDLIVLQSKTTKVSFKDSLIPPAAVITIGIDSTDADIDLGIRWSLTLSHLRHYGDPVRVDTCENNTRITMDQLNIVGFGAFMSTWGLTTNNFLPAATFITTVWDCLLRCCPKDELSVSFPWLAWATKTAHDVIASSKNDPESTTMLLGFGSRRSAKFLGMECLQNLPAFGLCDAGVLHALCAESPIESGIRYLRYMSECLKLPSSHAVIVYPEIVNGQVHLVFGSARQLLSEKLKRLGDGVRKQNARHYRWISHSTHVFNDQNLPNTSWESLEEMENSRISPSEAELIGRLENSKSAEELFVFRGMLPSFSGNMMYWPEAPSEYRGTPQTGRGDAYVQDKSQKFLFTRLLGHERSMALFVRLENEPHLLFYKNHIRTIQFSTAPVRSAEEILKSEVCPSTLLAYFRFRQPPSNITIPRDDIFWMMCSDSLIGRLIEFPTTLFLKALAIASAIYAQLPSATIPSKITTTPIDQATWLQSVPDVIPGNILNSISRAEAFACITMFESGGIDIEPAKLEKVIAVSAANSIFVAGVLLTDPTKNLPLAAIKRVIGNVGAPGVCLLVVPEKPRIKSINYDYSAVMHAEYDRKREDSFQGTSLRLSFTGWKVPIIWGAEDYIDQDVHFLGAVISVRDQGSWIADIDVLRSLPDIINSCLPEDPSCACQRPASTLQGYFVSIDNWNELLDISRSGAVVRSHSNWWGRLAAACVLRRAHPDRPIVLVNKQVECWNCLGTWIRLEDDLTPLPFILID